MHLKLYLGTGLAVSLLACGSEYPTAPIPPSSTLSSPAPTPQEPPPRLTGVVQDDRGAPIAGVVVHANLGTDDETDDQGRFEVTTSAPAGVYFGVQIRKTGYEYISTFLQGPTAIITLHDFIRLPAGESLRLTISPYDSVGPPGDVEYRFRSIRVVSQTPTGVELRVVADDGGAVDWFCYAGPPGCPPSSNVTACCHRAQLL